MTENTEESLRVKILIERHRELDDLIDSMSSRRGLTETDYQALKVLKVKRLRCKDAIQEIKRENEE
tara:strand:- start:102 stop:299 length:198 start_codon:yes stop_codon:yes gene_type:complete